MSSSPQQSQLKSWWPVGQRVGHKLMSPCLAPWHWLTMNIRQEQTLSLTRSRQMLFCMIQCQNYHCHRFILAPERELRFIARRLFYQKKWLFQIALVGKMTRKPRWCVFNHRWWFQVNWHHDHCWYAVSGALIKQLRWRQKEGKRRSNDTPNRLNWNEKYEWIETCFGKRMQLSLLCWIIFTWKRRLGPEASDNSAPKSWLKALNQQLKIDRKHVTTAGICFFSTLLSALPLLLSLLESHRVTVHEDCQCLGWVSCSSRFPKEWLPP